LKICHWENAMTHNGTAIKFSERYLPERPALDLSR
jgi:hypothetical protein